MAIPETCPQEICRKARSALVAMAARVAVAAMLGTSLAACNARQEVISAPQPVQAMTIRPAPREETVTWVGTVRPRHESDLGFRVAGKIVERLVDVGDRVAAGQVLARLDPVDLNLALQSQEAEVRAARSGRDQAVAAEDRAKSLVNQGIVARATLDQRQAAADEARSRVERAERNLSLSQNQLGYADLRADAAGVVSALPVEKGQVVTAGQLVARVARFDTLEAQVDVPEHQTEIARTAKASVSIWGAETVLPAHLRELSPVADRTSRTYQARFTIDASNELLRMGRTVSVKLQRGGEADVARIPLAALMSDGVGPAVWTLNASGDRVRRTAVRVLAYETGVAVIGAGAGEALASGDRIVSLGVHMLDEGKPVRVIEMRADAR